MHESICQFGDEKNLVGVFTEPTHERLAPNAPTAIILNAGIVHRVGPFRLHVDLARQLAALGFSTLRMDLSGLGDSRPRLGKIQTGQSRAMNDVSEAMRFLESHYGQKKFVLIGLCSGAFNAHQVSTNDPRVVGSVFLDGIVFRTFGFYVRRYFSRLINLRYWRNFILRRLRRRSTAGKNQAAEQALAESEFFGEELSRESVSQDLHSMISRGVRTLFLYTDGYDDVCGRGQFKEMFGICPDDDQIQVEYYPKSEHTFRLIENRKVACQRISDWFASQFKDAGKRQYAEIG